MTSSCEDSWSAWLDALQAWSRRTTHASLARSGTLPELPAGGPEGPVPPGLRVRAQLCLAELGAAEELVRRRREQLVREHTYS